MQKNLDTLIEENGAMPKRLLTRFSGLTHVSVAQAIRYGREYYMLSEAFGLGAAGYIGVVASEVRTAQGRRRSILEELLQQATSIFADDLGLLRGAYGGGDRGLIHYRLFEQQCRKIGLVAGSTTHLPETVQLLAVIRDPFGTMPGGISVFKVIETIAYKVVEHQVPFFLAIEDENKAKVYALEDLSYTNIHLEIEGEHAAESNDLVQLLLEIGVSEDVLAATVVYLSARLGAYWNALERHVFA